MEINNWFDFILYTTFTIGTLFISLPSGIWALKKAIEGVIRFGWGKLPFGFIDGDWGKSPLELFFVGIFGIFFSIWYLLIDKGGHLFYCIKEVREFFG